MGSAPPFFVLGARLPNLYQHTVMRRFALLIGIALLGVPSAAAACRVPIPLEQRIEAWHAQELFTAMAIVEVTQTRSLEDPWGKREVWAKQARVLAAQGRIEVDRDLEFADELFFSSCGWINNVPAQPGDKLAVYLTRGEGEVPDVFLAFPFNDALSRDPLLRALAVEKGLTTSPKR
jgi:hypothetical protein